MDVWISAPCCRRSRRKDCSLTVSVNKKVGHKSELLVDVICLRIWENTKWAIICLENEEVRVEFAPFSTCIFFSFSAIVPNSRAIMSSPSIKVVKVRTLKLDRSHLLLPAIFSGFLGPMPMLN